MKLDSIWRDATEHLSQHWLRYTALAVTAILTGFSAFSYTNNLFFSFALISLAEGASIYWSLRIEDYANWQQQVSAFLGMAISWTAIALTNLASVTIVAQTSNIEIFTIFALVPEWAQRIVVYVIPSLAVINGVLASFHHFFSEISKMHRDVSRERLAARYTIEKSKATAQIAIARAEANRFVQLAELNAGAIGDRRGSSRWKNTAAREDVVEEGELKQASLATPDPTQDVAPEQKKALISKLEDLEKSEPRGIPGIALVNTSVSPEVESGYTGIVEQRPDDADPGVQAEGDDSMWPPVESEPEATEEPDQDPTHPLPSRW